MSTISCCLTHDATRVHEHTVLCASLSKMYPAGAQLVTGGQPVAWGGQLAFAAFACTQALTALAAQRPVPCRHSDGTTTMPAVLKVSTMKMCKQHTAGGCKLGAMCRNVHVCRLAGSSASGKPPTTTTTTVRCESASRGGVRLPPLGNSVSSSTSSSAASSSIRRASPAVYTLPALNTGAAPERSCTSPMKSARSTRLSGLANATFSPAPPPSRSAAAADLEDIVLISTPVPTPPPRSPCPQQVATSTGSGCFRRFAKRWNEPLKTSSSGAVVTPSMSLSLQASSAGNSIDLELVQANVNVLQATTGCLVEDEDESEEDEFSAPLPPTNASGEGRCYARKSAFGAKEGCFAVFTN